MRKVIVTAAIIMTSLTLCSGQGNWVQSAIHFNKSFYVNGDTAWFNVFLPIEFEYKNSLASVEIHSVIEKQTVDGFHLPIDELGRGKGFTPISHIIPSGSYLVVIKVWNEQTDQPLEVINHELIVFNDSQNISSLKLDNTTALTSVFPKAGISTLKVNIKTDLAEYFPRQQVEVKIKVVDEQGKPVKSNLSISVTKKDEGVMKSSISNGISVDKVQTAPFLVEDNIILNGTVTELDKDRPLARSFLLAFLEKEGSTFSLNTEDEGKFNLELPPYIGNYSMQFHDSFGRNFGVDLDQYKSFSSASSTMDDRVNPEILRDYLQKSRVRKKVKYLFGGFEGSAAKKTSTWDFEVDYTVWTKNYEPFESLKEFMETVITPLRIHKSGRELKPKMVNPQSKPFFHEAPVFLVNKQITTFEDVMAIDLKDIERIDFFNTSATLRHFGQLGKNGIAAIYTNRPVTIPDLSRTILINGVQKEDIYQIQLSKGSSDRTPIFDPEVYWNPYVDSDESGEVTITFPNNDDIGEYEIRVLGRSDDGRWCTGTFEYEVNHQANPMNDN